MGSRRIAIAIVTAFAFAVLTATSASAFDPTYEARNYSKINERYVNESGTPAYQSRLASAGTQSELELAQIKATDPERDSSTNLCQHHLNGCAGDVRFYDWQTAGYGIRKPVLYTARDGAVISGHIWATKAGPAARPGVVITTGSVQAPEELYAFAAATLAKKGYVVLTYDVETQGRSDSHGAGGDSGYYQAQTPGPFVDGTQDALDFFFSTPAHPYEPRFPAPAGAKALAEGHRPKQDRRVKAGLANAYNPLSSMLDPTRVGIVGHSLGAFAVSQVAAEDQRVKAVVAYDNLSAGGGSMFGQTTPLITARVPALGMSADYGLTPTPNASDPDPLGKSDASLKASALGVDTGELVIRGGTHYEFSYIPNPAFGATLRGMDMVAWYTSAWMDRYVKGNDSTADARLLTTRWLDDSAEQAVDPIPDGNLFSTYFRSRIDIGHSNGRRVHCENLRAGTANCSGLAPDGAPTNYSYLKEAFTPDRATTGTGPGAGLTPAEVARFRQSVRLHAPRLSSDEGTTAHFRVRVRPAARADAVDRYELQVATGPRGRYRTLTFGLGVPDIQFAGADGRTYRFRTRAIGRGGVIGPWRDRTTVTPTDDAGHGPRFGPGWARARDVRAYRAGLARTARAGARMSFAFTGRRVYLIGRKERGGGRAVVLLDGRRQVVDFYARRTRERTVVFSRYVAPRRRHTLVVIATGLHHPRARGASVAVDAVGVLQR